MALPDSAVFASVARGADSGSAAPAGKALSRAGHTLSLRPAISQLLTNGLPHVQSRCKNVLSFWSRT